MIRVLQRVIRVARFVGRSSAAELALRFPSSIGRVGFQLMIALCSASDWLAIAVFNFASVGVLQRVRPVARSAAE
jgi:hypothetical protein